MWTKIKALHLKVGDQVKHAHLPENDNHIVEITKAGKGKAYPKMVLRFNGGDILYFAEDDVVLARQS